MCRSNPVAAQTGAKNTRALWALCYLCSSAGWRSIGPPYHSEAFPVLRLCVYLYSAVLCLLPFSRCVGREILGAKVGSISIESVVSWLFCGEVTKFCQVLAVSWYNCSIIAIFSMFLVCRSGSTTAALKNYTHLLLPAPLCHCWIQIVLVIWHSNTTAVSCITFRVSTYVGGHAQVEWNAHTAYRMGCSVHFDWLYTWEQPAALIGACRTTHMCIVV